MDEGLGKEPEKKKINEDLVMFMRKRNDNDAPRYTARLKTYVDIQRKRRRAGIARRISEASDHKFHKQQDPTEKEENKSEHPGSDEDGKTSIIKASAKGYRGRKPHNNTKSQQLLISGWFSGGARKDAGGKERRRSKSKSQTDDDAGMEGGIQYAKRDVSRGKEDRPSQWQMSPLKKFIASMCRRRRRRSCRRRRRRSCRRRRRRRRSCRRRRRRRSCRRRRRRRSCRRRRRRRC